MKLYYTPGACSLADHIAMHHAGLAFEHEKVDLRAKTTETGADFTAINPKGYVPALALDSGEVLSENVAILDWVAGQAAALQAPGTLSRTHTLEALAYINSEIHKSFKPFFAGGSDEEKVKAGEMIVKRMRYLADTMQGDYLFGDQPSVADFYLFVMLVWAKKQGIDAPEPLSAYRDRIMALPATQTAMSHEGLI